jgi:hypothetical protein
MKRLSIRLIIALLTFAMGIVAYICWNFTSSSRASVFNERTNTCFIVKPVISQETILDSYSEYVDKHCPRRNWNPEREKLLVERLNRKSQKKVKSVR